MSKKSVEISKNTLSKQTTGLKRETTDKFYTKKEIVEACIDYLKCFISIDDNDLFIEPSAGNGSFITEIKNISSNHEFYDLKPENKEIKKPVLF